MEKSGIRTIDPYSLISDGQKNGQSFYEIELEYLNSIKNSDMHIVYNQFDQRLQSNISEYTSIELAYALIHNKPVFLISSPIFSESVPKEIQEVINKNLENIFIAHLDKFTKKALYTFIKLAVKRFKSYKITPKDEVCVLKYITKLLAEW